MHHFNVGIYATRNVCVKDIDSRASMVLQNYQKFRVLTSNIIYIVALGVGFKCPRKIHLNTQCPPPCTWSFQHPLDSLMTPQIQPQCVPSYRQSTTTNTILLENPPYSHQHSSHYSHNQATRYKIVDFPCSTAIASPTMPTQQHHTMDAEPS